MPGSRSRGGSTATGDAALAEASSRAAALGAPGRRARLRRGRLHQQHRHRPDRPAPGRGAAGPSRGPGARPDRALPGDLPDHPPVRLRDARRRRGGRAMAMAVGREEGATTMPETATRVEVRSTDDPTATVVAIFGDVTGRSEPALMEAYVQAVDGGARTIVLDFAGLEYMNSGGIGLLVTLLVRAQRAGSAPARRRPVRPLPRDLLADPPRRGDRDPRRRRRGRRGRAGA